MNKKNIALSVFSILFVLILIHFLDVFIGFFFSNDQDLFPKCTSERYKTSEFDYTASINSMGFRDREFGTKLANYRVIVIGDSFTYGWGVDLCQAWPKLLEINLRANGIDAEVANLGKPGASPEDYDKCAEKAIFLLKPDLVVVCVSQGDDLAQLSKNGLECQKSNSNEILKMLRKLKVGIKTIYPNLFKMRAKLQKSENNMEIMSAWKNDVQMIISTFNPDEKRRFEYLSDSIKKVFINGEVNPALLSIAIKKPNYFYDTLDLKSNKVQELINDMSHNISNIKKITHKNKAKLIVISVPYRVYVSYADFKQVEKLGFRLDKKMLSGDSMDQAIMLACKRANVRFFEVTQDFREESKNHPLYFTIDGHFNPDGNKYFAKMITPIIENQIKSRDTSAR